MQSPGAPQSGRCPRGAGPSRGRAAGRRSTRHAARGMSAWRFDVRRSAPARPGANSASVRPTPRHVVDVVAHLVVEQGRRERSPVSTRHGSRSDSLRRPMLPSAVVAVRVPVPAGRVHRPPRHERFDHAAARGVPRGRRGPGRRRRPGERPTRPGTRERHGRARAPTPTRPEARVEPGRRTLAAAAATQTATNGYPRSRGGRARGTATTDCHRRRPHVHAGPRCRTPGRGSRGTRSRGSHWKGQEGEGGPRTNR